MGRGLLCLLLLQLVGLVVAGGGRWRWQEEFLRLPSSDEATRWAVLIAGSNGFYNYRHQADVCHAYQIMRKGGVEEQNIVVMMYDDIAHNPDNPRPGLIFNHPSGPDVYAGVPKDYTGDDVNVNNFLAVLLGNRSALTGSGSGKVVASGPNDHVFVYYADHGGPGVLSMPADGEYLYADDLESSWGTYCPGDDHDAPAAEFDTCLGDLYSVAWMEDAEAHQEGRLAETLRQQYRTVKNRTSDEGTYTLGSHVMQYGDMALAPQSLDLYYMDTSPATANDHKLAAAGAKGSHSYTVSVNQRDADLLYLWRKYRRAGEGTAEKVEARERLVQEMGRRSRVDRSVEMIGGLLLGGAKHKQQVVRERAALVEDWECLRSMVRTFEDQCGSLGQYGIKHMRSFANICNAGVPHHAMAKAASLACPSPPPLHLIDPHH
ncbi:hypothetical protein OsI_21225 [Oryza sativa Indica Group]|uniref:Legumain prodomain domain-containing protein n=1 Tax=Oryza sativa subsp. indica TaxID=39946 RepID=A2Y851_ORYSI|nr:hypothetical protein OsI_21225 [Oryza sativa Indica Group]